MNSFAMILSRAKLALGASGRMWKRYMMLLLKRHCTGLAADTLQEFHAADVIGPRYLQAPGSIPGRARLERSAHQMLTDGRTYPIEASQQIKGGGLAIREHNGHALFFVVDFADRKSQSDLHAGPLGRSQQDLMQP